MNGPLIIRAGKHCITNFPSSKLIGASAKYGIKASIFITGLAKSAKYGQHIMCQLLKLTRGPVPLCTLFPPPLLPGLGRGKLMSILDKSLDCWGTPMGSTLNRS